MVNVARNGVNTIVFRKVTLRFRQVPGNDAAGALGRATYVVRAGASGVGGLTREDGSVTLRVPAGGSAMLEIFGSVYEIGTAGPLPPASDLRGAQRRLNMLGYLAGPLDGKQDARTENALLDFQADHEILPTGLLDEATARRLEKEAGA